MLGNWKPFLSGCGSAAGSVPARQVSTARTGIGGPDRKTLSSPPPPGLRDGVFANGIITHESGHGFSNRLTGGPNVNCLGGVEQMGEGWSDYVAIASMIDPEVDDPEGTRGMGTYVIFQDDRGDSGIRNRPYSRTMDIQPFTYGSIKTGAWLNGTTIVAPHQVGHGWASILWDITWDLIEKHGFNPNMYDDWSTGGNNPPEQSGPRGEKLPGGLPRIPAGRAGLIAAHQALTAGGNP